MNIEKRKAEIARLTRRKPRSVLEALQRARALIADRRWWCNGAYARDARGESCDSKGKDAISFCALGALFRVCGMGYSYGSADALRRNSEGEAVAWLNDKRGHAAVLRLYDKAIAGAKKGRRRR